MAKRPTTASDASAKARDAAKPRAPRKPGRPTSAKTAKPKPKAQAKAAPKSQTPPQPESSAPDALADQQALIETLSMNLAKAAMTAQAAIAEAALSQADRPAAQARMAQVPVSPDAARTRDDVEALAERLRRLATAPPPVPRN